MRTAIRRIMLILSESKQIGTSWSVEAPKAGCCLTGESRIRVIWTNLWDRSMIICPYSWGTQDNPGAPTIPHLTTNPYGCYQCSEENYQGVDEHGDDVWLF